MSKKRKCELTAEERSNHAEAVRLRKMPDKQLVEAFHQAQTSGIHTERTSKRSESAEKAKAEKDNAGVKRLLDELAGGKCKGIKGATASKISEFAAELGLI